MADGSMVFFTPKNMLTEPSNRQGPLPLRSLHITFSWSASHFYDAI